MSAVEIDVVLATFGRQRLGVNVMERRDLLVL